MKVMTYNIRLGIQQGVEAIAGILRQHQPDIVALQEVGHHWTMGPSGDTTAQLRDTTHLEHAHYVTTIEEAPDHRYGHALLSRWPIDVDQIFRFTQEIDEPRAALVVRIDSDQGPLSVIATHLSHRDAERSVHGTELVELTGRVLAAGHPTLLLGDLNEVDDADWMHALKDNMRDAGDLTEGGTYPNPEPMVRIDYILASRGRWTSAQILEEIDASDHRPLVGRWELDSD